MHTIILAFVIALAGLVMIASGDLAAFHAQQRAKCSQ
jgi:hypothetical protein